MLRLRNACAIGLCFHPEDRAKLAMAVEIQPFGETQDGAARLFVLTHAGGLLAKLTDYGAALVELQAPDREGRLADVAGGFAEAAGYAGLDKQCFGATVGRVANRIANAEFTLDGRIYRLARNLPPHHLHGGVRRSLDRVLWQAEVEPGSGTPAVRFSYRSPDGEEGYPGNLDLSVSYTLDGRDLRLEYGATTDRATPINLTNHAYWNLAGHDAGSILDHDLTLRARRYTPADEALIPTGAIAPVEGTPFDFTRPRRIGERIAGLEPGGYDHNFVLEGGIDGEPALAARLREPLSGRVLEVHTTEPGLQLYTGNGLRGQRGKAGVRYGRHSLLCLEAQHFPDALHHEAFPSIVLRPGEVYRQTTIYRFVTE